MKFIFYVILTFAVGLFNLTTCQTTQNALSQQVKLSESLNEDYIKCLAGIGENDQMQRKKRKIDWTIQNRLDSLNRMELDRLFEDFGFPTKDKVSNEGVLNAFMVLHHSLDCKWNEKWTKRFLQHIVDIHATNLNDLFAFYFFRNFNQKDGCCQHNQPFIEELRQGKDSLIVKPFLDFTKWEKMFE